MELFSRLALLATKWRVTVQNKTNTATVEELFGMSPDELRTEFKKAFARLKWAVNGYEMIEFLQWLTEGCIGCELFGSTEKVGCYCKGDSGAGGVWLYVERRSVEALLRMRLVESRIAPGEAQPLYRKLYVATTNGEKFFSEVPNTYRGGEPNALKPDEDRQFWTAILEQAPNEPPAVYPYLASAEPDGRTILSIYNVIPAEGCNVRVTGPHSLRWIPPSAIALDAYPVLGDTVGPRIIRSWFDTVINPILESLKLEQRLLEDRNWTWRVPPGHLESIRPVEESAWQVSVDNLEQLISFYPNVEDLIERHDQEVSELQEACRALHMSLSASTPAKNAYDKAKQDSSLTRAGTTINSVLRGPEERDLDLLAQYIVNTADELLDYYVYSPVWNKYKSDFLVSLEDPVVKPLRDSTVQAGDRLLGTVTDLSALLKETRAGLSLQFDVPFTTGQSSQDE